MNNGILSLDVVNEVKSILTKFKPKDPVNESLELEIRFGIVENNNLKSGVQRKTFYRLIDDLKELNLYPKITETEDENTVIPGPQGTESVRKTTTVSTGSVAYMKKEVIYTYSSIDYSFKISIAKETKLPLNQSFKSGNGQNGTGFKRYKRRRTYLLAKEGFKIDLTEVTTNDNRVSYEIEFELIDNNIDLQKLVTRAFKLVNDTFDVYTNAEKEDVIRYINVSLESPRGDDKYFDISNLALPRNIKYKDILYGGIVGHPDVTYNVTHKTDGRRKQLVVYNSNIWLFSLTNEYNKITGIESLQYMNGYILDGELVPKAKRLKGASGAEYWFLIFDCLAVPKDAGMINGASTTNSSTGTNGASATSKVSTTNSITGTRNIQDEPFLTRIEAAQQLADVVKTQTIELNTKTFLSLDTPIIFFDILTKMFAEQEEQTLRYVEDGFIFTPIEIGYDVIKRNKNVERYERTVTKFPEILKWKRKEQLTIDLEINWQRSNIELLMGNKQPFQGDWINTFNNSMIDMNQKLSEASSGMIGEFFWDYDRKLLVLERIRSDKTKPNAEDIIMDVWEDIHNPIEKDTLTGNSMNLLRRYHNRIKGSLYRFIKTRRDRNNNQGFKNTGGTDGLEQDDIAELADVNSKRSSNNFNGSRNNERNNDRGNGNNYRNNNDRGNGNNFRNNDRNNERGNNYRNNDRNNNRNNNNSFNIKPKPLNTSTETELTLLDIGSGRGGDVSKWKAFSKVVAVEPNAENYRELVNRIAVFNMQDRVLAINVKGEDTKSITAAVKKFIGTRVDVVSMMLSLSYFWESKQTLDKLFQTIITNISETGKFIFLTIDGNVVENFFEPQLGNGVSLNDIRFGDYFLMKYNVNTSPVSVDVFMKDSILNNREWLVKLDDLILLFSKYGFKNTLIYRSDKEKLLSQPEKVFSSMFTYGLFEAVADTSEVTKLSIYETKSSSSNKKKFPVEINVYERVTIPDIPDLKIVTKSWDQEPVIPFKLINLQKDKEQEVTLVPQTLGNVKIQQNRVLVNDGLDLTKRPATFDGISNLMTPKSFNFTIFPSIKQVVSSRSKPVTTIAFKVADKIPIDYFPYNDDFKVLITQNLFRVSAIDDNSSFFHCLMKAVSKKYQEALDLGLRKRMVREFRRDLAFKLNEPLSDNLTYYEGLNKGLFATLFLKYNEFSIEYLQLKLNSNDLLDDEFLFIVSDLVGLDFVICQVSESAAFKYVTSTLIGDLEERPIIIMSLTGNHYELIIRNNDVDDDSVAFVFEDPLVQEIIVKK